MLSGELFHNAYRSGGAVGLNRIVLAGGDKCGRRYLLTSSLSSGARFVLPDTVNDSPVYFVPTGLIAM